MESKQSEDQTLWVFLDEFNTCNEMDLMNEIIAEHKIEGLLIPNNIIIVAAANPYKERIKDIDEIGLNYGA